MTQVRYIQYPQFLAISVSVWHHPFLQIGHTHTKMCCPLTAPGTRTGVLPTEAPGTRTGVLPTEGPGTHTGCCQLTAGPTQGCCQLTAGPTQGATHWQQDPHRGATHWWWDPHRGAAHRQPLRVSNWPFTFAWRMPTPLKKFTQLQRTPYHYTNNASGFIHGGPNTSSDKHNLSI